jgi:site-specific DNA-adenine methylase
MSILRYPGGKTRLAKQIVRIIKRILQHLTDITEFREPFVGCFAVGLGVLQE